MLTSYIVPAEQRSAVSHCLEHNYNRRDVNTVFKTACKLPTTETTLTEATTREAENGACVYVNAVLDRISGQ